MTSWSVGSGGERTVSASDEPDALTRRIAQLVATSADPDAQGKALSSLVDALRTEVGAVQAELGTLRAEAQARVAVVQTRLESAGDDIVEQVVGRLTEVVSAQAGALEQRLVARLDDARAQEQEHARALREGMADVAAMRVEAGQDRAAVALLGEQTDVRGAQLADRVGELGGRVEVLGEQVHAGVDASERALAALAEASRALESTVDGFRLEWPTRTFEVVEGARAVADAVVRDVRAEVLRQLETVRSELDRATGRVEGAREDVRAGSDRLAQAGQGLVAYLEQRDRLLETERDRTLYEVLEVFTRGLSNPERTALTERVSKALDRRRDARDAERYRAGADPLAHPTDELPVEVRALVPGASGAGSVETAPQPVAANEPQPQPQPQPQPRPQPLSLPLSQPPPPPQPVTDSQPPAVTAPPPPPATGPASVTGPPSVAAGPPDRVPAVVARAGVTTVRRVPPRPEAARPTRGRSVPAQSATGPPAARAGAGAPDEDAARPAARP